MRIALIGPPFIEIPPRRYGGTELFLANLACELHARGHDVVVYGNGESRLPCPVRYRYACADWPLADPVRGQLKNVDHAAWAIHDAARWADVLHLNDIVAVPFTRFVDVPAALTLHHPQDAVLSEHYARYPDIHYVAIADWLVRGEQRLPNLHVVHHGIPVREYRYSARKEDYVAFLGRMVPCKGPHLAIAAARRGGLRLKLAGELQPMFGDYWQREVQPLIDGDQIVYLGEADRAMKNDLLAGARALLFPIQWDEPFGLVMIEAMACGTPVLAFRGGSVDEIVKEGVNGWICRDVDAMAARAADPQIDPAACRAFVEAQFSVERMAERYLAIYRRVSRGCARQATELEV